MADSGNKHSLRRIQVLGVLAFLAFAGLVHSVLPADLSLAALPGVLLNDSAVVLTVGSGSILLALAWFGLWLFYLEQNALARFEQAARKLINRDHSVPFEADDYAEFPGLVSIVNDLVGQLDASMEAQRSLSEIDSLILSGADMTAIIRRCLLAANLDALDTRLLLRPDMQSQQLIMHRLDGLKVTAEVVSLLDMSPAALNNLDHYWQMAAAQCDHVIECYPIACDEQLAGVLFVAGHRSISALESKRLTDLVDRLSVAVTNITRAETLYQQAHFDPLTGLLNRRAFEDRLKESLSRSRRNETGVLLFIDLDGFKKVNDTEGHEAGDKLLVLVAERLRAALRPEDIIARLGGDEFGLIAPGSADEASITAICERIITSVAGPVVVERMEHTIGASIGVARYPEDGYDLDEVVMKADSAMYRAKESGGSRFAFFDDSLKEANDHRILVESRLRNAIKQHDLQLHFQPKLDLQAWALSSSEALLRWNDEQLGEVNPAEFIGVAEDTGLIHNIMPLIVDGATSLLRQAEQRGIEIQTIALNASPKQIMSDGFALSVLSMLDMRNVAHEKIEVEVTESVLAQDMAQVLSELHILRMAGIKVALDDFGTGYSSLNMLRELPLDTVKIDRAFITELESSNEARRMLKHLIDIAKVLGLQVVAEGVETDVQLQYLLDHGCDVVQGFLISRALSEPQYLAMVEEWGVGRPALSGHSSLQY
jgi:diguanylate cyclase (GGDEF)-like protein